MKHFLLLLAILVFQASAPSNTLRAGNNFTQLKTASASIHSQWMPNNLRIVTDPFIGVFTMSAYSQVMGNVTITHAGGDQYKVDSGDGFDMAVKIGVVLEGTSQGIPFRIRANGDNLIMELLGVNFDLIRTSGQQPVQQSPVVPNQTAVSGTIDQRLLGLWRYTHVQKSGSDQMVTDYRISFIDNGNYYTESEWAGMGSSGKDRRQYGTYQIASMNNSGGVVRLDGKEMEYFFSGNNMRLGSTTIYELVRK